MSDTAPQQVLFELGVAVLENGDDGSFSMRGEIPAWFHRLAGEVRHFPSGELEKRLPFLESFLPDARSFWGEGGEGRLRSGLCAELDESGAEYHFEVSAFRADSRRLLLFELRRDFDETREILQKARQNMLDYELLERTQRALERSQSELRKARDVAEAATAAKSAFLAHMSHEIRNPMNAILGLTGLLLNSALNARQREFLEIVRNSGETLLTILNDILDFSKIESGRLDLEMQPMDIRRAVEESLDLFSVQAAEKGLELSCRAGAEVPVAVMGDATRLRQILANLIGNAVKFTPAGEIAVSVDGLPDGNGEWELHFAVADTGIGIPRDRMNRLFQSFSQVDASVARKYGGTGLGLAICKKLAERMRGRMWVESEEGKGSVFQFTIRAGPAELPTPEWLGTEHPHLGGKTLWIVGSTASNRKLVGDLARFWGMHCCVTASAGELSRWLASGTRCDVLLFDLPEDSRDLSLLPEPRIELVAGGRLQEENVHYSRAGRLTKPLKPAQLHALLTRFFSGGSMQDMPMTVTTPVPAPAAGESLRILLADDSPINRKVGLALLESLGYGAELAGNGLEALQALHRKPYDVVLMDVQMPEVDGWEATRRIRSEIPAERQPRILAMTANVLEEDRKRCREAGMDDYVSKPVRAEELRAALNRCKPAAGLPPARAEAPVAPQAAESEGFDPAVVSALRAIGRPGGPDMFTELLQMFRELLREQITRMGNAISNGEAEALRHAAHKLRGSSANLGAAGITGLSGKLEAIGEKGTVDGAADLLQEIERMAAKILQDAEEKGVKG